MNQTQPHSVVFLIDSLSWGGAERLLVTYLQHIDTSRFTPRVVVFRVRDGNPLAREIRQLDYPVDLIPVRNLRDISGLIRLVRYLRQHKTDLLHTQLQAADVFGSIAAQLVGIPTVSTLHTLEDSPAPSTSSYGRRLLTWWVLGHFCDKIIAVSEETRQHHMRAGGLGPDRVVTLYNGIDLPPFEPVGEASCWAGREALGIPRQAPLLVTVAVLRPGKGIHYMIQALPAIMKVVPDVHYMVVGSGEYETELKTLAMAHDVADRVIFTGVRQDIAHLLALSDVFVLPSLSEALPTVLAEAMAARKPIVATRVGGIPEMVEHNCNGLLVPPAEPGSLVEACIQLLQNSEQARAMGAAGRVIVEERFNIHKQVQRLSDLYQELLIKHSREKN